MMTMLITNAMTKTAKKVEDTLQFNLTKISSGRVLVSPPSGRAASALVGFKVAFNIDKSQFYWSPGFGITVDIEDESSGTWMPVPPK